MMIILSIALFFFIVCLQLSRTSSAQIGLNEAKMTDELRNVILNAHNDFRKKLVNGKVKDAKGNLPTGKNIYKFSYNKNKEYIAQKTANICKMEHPGTVGYGENLYANSWAMDNLTEAMLGAANGWWGEKDVCPINENNLKVTDKVFDKCGHWVPMAWSHTTEIFCGVQLCPPQFWCSNWKPPCYNTTLISCNYYNPTNDAGNILIYEKGQRCRKDSDCTWYKNSKCEIKTGLCLAPKDAKDPKIK
uniref:SCP domain-containing protein n=2 Tax=Meloidogyne TaxID=189290 RepID=A0A6V7XP80_MELEN|nr:unnamed protein product [Meloidogyne enterolobii]